MNDVSDDKGEIAAAAEPIAHFEEWFALAKAKEPNDPDTGKPKTDTLNPDPAKRSRPLLGLQVVLGLTPNGANRWSGEIYNADDGKTYSAHMMPNGNTAKVQGCVLGFLCKTQNWKRAN